MKFTSSLAILAAIAVAGALAAPVAVDSTSALEARSASNAIASRSVASTSDASLTFAPRTIDPAALKAELAALLHKLGAEKTEIIKYLYWIRNVLGYKKKHLLAELEALLEKHGLASKKDWASGKIPADIEAILTKLGKDKPEAIQWLYYIKNVLGSKKGKLVGEIEEVVEKIIQSAEGKAGIKRDDKDGIPSWPTDAVFEWLEQLLGPIDGII